MKKGLFALSCTLLAVTATSCGVREDNTGGNGGGVIGELSTDKTNIKIGTFDGGVKAKWLEIAKPIFEEKFKDVEYEPGKKGVNLMIELSTSFSGNDLLNNPLSQDMYFTESVNYTALVNADKCLDMSDVFNYKNDGESKTILEKLPEELQTNLNVDGKYYAVPFWDGLFGFVYDKTLFEEEGLYLDKTGKALSNNLSLSHSKGPNGVDEGGKGDDGLPATYDEFKSWCTLVKGKNIWPFVYSAAYSEYVDSVMVNYWADYEGKEQFYLNYSFEGTATDLVKENQDPTVSTNLMDPLTIAEDNGYVLQRQAGKYHALDFLFSTVNENYATGIGTHTEAQQNFINNGNGTTKYAMLIDGSWWENEAKSAINSAKDNYGYRHDFAIMPVPKATKEKVGSKSTVVSNCEAYGFIAKNCSCPQACKDLMKFLHSDEQLKSFTKETNMTRAFNVDWTDSELNELSSYARSLVDLKKNADVVYPISKSALLRKNPSIFNYKSYPWAIDGSTSPFKYKKTNGGSVSARTYFDSLFTYYKSRWGNLSK